MTNILIQLLNASRFVQRSCALGLTSLIGLSLWGVLSWIITDFATTKASIDEARWELGQMDVLATKAALISKENLKDNDAGLFLDGDSVPVMQAKLQERLKAMAAASGITVTAISGVPVTILEKAQFVGVRADVEGPFIPLHTMITQLEASVPPLIIRQAEIRSSTSNQQGLLTGPLKLTAQLTLYGAVNSNALLSLQKVP